MTGTNAGAGPETTGHTDVAAYALGLLEPADRQAFEEHLDGCVSCRAEISQFTGMRELLSDIDPETLGDSVDDGGSTTGADSGAPDLAGRRTSRRPRTRTMLVNVAAAAVLLVGGTLLGTWIAGGEQPGGSQQWAAQLILTGERFSATDQATGTTGVVGIEPKRWGTHVALELRGVKGPLTCELVVISKQGAREVAASWFVPPAGYGVPGSPDPLVLHGGTAVERHDIAGFEVRTTTGRTILTVPA